MLVVVVVVVIVVVEEDEVIVVVVVVEVVVVYIVVVVVVLLFLVVVYFILLHVPLPAKMLHELFHTYTYKTMLISSYNHCYILHWFVYINKSDFSYTENNGFFGDLKKRFFGKPIKLIFHDHLKKIFLEIVNIPFSSRYEKAFFRKWM